MRIGIDIDGTLTDIKAELDLAANSTYPKFSDVPRDRPSKL